MANVTGLVEPNLVDYSSEFFVKDCIGGTFLSTLILVVVSSMYHVPISGSTMVIHINSTPSSLMSLSMYGQITTVALISFLQGCMETKTM